MEVFLHTVESHLHIVEFLIQRNFLFHCLKKYFIVKNKGIKEKIKGAEREAPELMES